MSHIAGATAFIAARRLASARSASGFWVSQAHQEVSAAHGRAFADFFAHTGSATGGGGPEPKSMGPIESPGTPAVPIPKSDWQI